MDPKIKYEDKHQEPQEIHFEDPPYNPKPESDQKVAHKEPFKSELSSSKDKKFDTSSQDKLGRKKIDSNFEVKPAENNELELDNDSGGAGEGMYEGGAKDKKPNPPKEEKKKGGNFMSKLSLKNLKEAAKSSPSPSDSSDELW